MSNNTEPVPTRCTNGNEHRIGQRYDERRGTGNGPQICLLCGETLESIFQRICARERLDENERPTTFHIGQNKSKEFKAGFAEAMHQLCAAKSLRVDELQTQLEGEAREPRS